MSTDPNPHTNATDAEAARSSGPALPVDARTSRQGRRLPFWAVLVFLVSAYALGLTRAIDQPWTGMHDWNGAFFSQLARNLLRYPWSAHAGIPVVAVGEAWPASNERSMYATHPAGLVWLVAGSFLLLGEHEWAARLVPILASLGTLAMFVDLVRRSRGPTIAWMAGLIYAVMPMTVFFGRMVNHEPVCLFFMTATLWAWQRWTHPSPPAPSRASNGAWPAAWIAALVGAVFTDWPGMLFAAVFCLHAGRQHRRGRISRGRLAGAVGVTAAACLGATVHLVVAGLDGRWTDLAAIAVSRLHVHSTGPVLRDISTPGGAWTYAEENATWPLWLLILAGLVARLSRRPQTHVKDAEPPTSHGAPDDGLWTLSTVGIVWLAAFWQQFERHNYWMYYLGPTLALAGAWIPARLSGEPSRGRRLVQAAPLVMLAVVVAFSRTGSNDYFGRMSYSPADIAAWSDLNRRLAPNARILVSAAPTIVERRAGYVLRNVAPPQFAYYLDRPFDVEPDPASVAIRLKDYPAYIFWRRPTPRPEDRDEWSALFARFGRMESPMQIVLEPARAGT